jgi:hypothetical protein
MVLIEDLLDATVVSTLSRVLLTRGAIVGFLGIAEIIGLGDEVRGIYIRVAARWRGGIMFVMCCRVSDHGQMARHHNTTKVLGWRCGSSRAERAVECNESDRWASCWSKAP